MSDRIGTPVMMKLRKPMAIATAALLTITAATKLAWPQAATQPAPSSQTAPAPPAPQQSEPTSQPAPKENPGLIDEIGKLLEKPASLLPALKGPQETIKETIDDAADALSRWTTSAGVKGRAACPPAANGAPDCKAAADKLCQSKGFKQGKSLDVDTARNCSAKALLSGRKPEESECRTDTYVTRAVCQ